MAEGPEAAQLSQQAAGDLRRSLEQQGLNLVEPRGLALRDDAAPTAPAPAPAGEGAAGPPRDAATTVAPRRPRSTRPTAQPTIELANGTLVDVLA